MKLNTLLHQRQAILAQARLANAAFAYTELGDFAARVSRANLRGLVTVQLTDASSLRVWPALLAEEGSQAVLDEHFVEHDVAGLADLLAFTLGDTLPQRVSFRIEELEGFRARLRQELESAGVEVPRENVFSEE
ncbi:MAG: hypothetical protein SFV32_05870 [Opitutaceae bacterium]|nr:hypothetical protein [Opitutaceae bacterium]